MVYGKRVIRFMSAQEAGILLAGHTIANKVEHSSRGMLSTSVGACFMIVDARKLGTIYHTARYLAGIVNFDYCLVGMTHRDNKPFVLTEGRYTNYDSPRAGQESVTRKEFSTTQYTLNDFEHWAFYLPDNSVFGGDDGLPVFMIGSYSGAWKNPVFQTCSCSAGGCKLKRAV